jgi:hypothetical protein
MSDSGAETVLQFKNGSVIEVYFISFLERSMVISDKIFLRIYRIKSGQEKHRAILLHKKGNK